MGQKVNPFIYWTPRILSILLLLFMTLFSLDVFEPGLTAWQIAVGLFMHNLPVLILAAVLIISWRYEIVGGIAFILADILFIIFTVVREDFEPWYISLAWSMILAVPAFIIGILFLVGWFKKK